MTTGGGWTILFTGKVKIHITRAKGTYVQIEFRTSKLRRQYEDAREAERAYGAQVARRYIERINILKHARDVEQLRQLPALDCHELKGDRRRQWAVRLTGFYRLIFTLQGQRLQIARIEEVSKHYGD